MRISIKKMKIDLIVGDAVKIIETLPEGSVDLIIADPPYNLEKNYETTADNFSFDEFVEFSRKWLSGCKRVLSDRGTIYVFMGMKHIAYVYAILEKELDMVFRNWITWHYTQGIGKTRGFSPRHDDILAFTKTGTCTFNLDSVRVPQKYYRSVNNMRGANPGNVWTFSHVHYCNASRERHPTQKPEGLYERMVLASSNEEDTVLDPFVGSGTCARICQQTNRNCIGVDINRNYIAMAKQRLKEPFLGFDSIDERMKRIPGDLPNDVKDEYIENHRKWFLKNQGDGAESFVLETQGECAAQPSLF